MKEELVSFETAQLAKKKGFNLSCKYGIETSLYTNKGEHVYYSNYGFFGSGLSGSYIKAPTQAALSKWLREEYNINVWVIPMWDYDYRVHWARERGKMSNYELGNYKTYEEALETGLIEALKLIK